MQRMINSGLKTKKPLGSGAFEDRTILPFRLTETRDDAPQLS